MLGSTGVLIEAGRKGRRRGWCFRVMWGAKVLPIIKDPDPPPAAEYLIMESTYGNRLHQPIGRVKQKLAHLVNRTAARGGHIVMPAFAVGRTQQVVLLLHELIDEKAIPDIPIFVDSPLAVNVTDVFRKHEEEWDDGARAFANQHIDPFGWERLRYIRTVQESKTLNGLRMPFIVIAASGMCEAGRVLHHLKNSVEDPKNLVLITGFQAQNTLGRAIVQRHPGGEDLRRADAAAVRGGLDRRVERARGSERVAGMDGANGVDAEEGLPGAWRTACPTTLKTEIEKLYKLEVVCPKRGDHEEVG